VLLERSRTAESDAGSVVSVEAFAGIGAAIFAVLTGAIAIVILLRRRGYCGGLGLSEYYSVTKETGTELPVSIAGAVAGLASYCNPETILESQAWEVASFSNIMGE
jgi:hypothetical protein